MTGAVVKIVLAAYMLFIFFLSIKPGAESFPDIWQIDKVYHFLAYALMAFLWMWILAPASSRKELSIQNRVLGTAFAISALFGAIMEFLQQFSPLREADIFDATANALGALVGAVAAGRALKVLDRRSSKMQMKGG